MKEVELTVDRIAVGGRGIGLDPDGRATFVAGAVPPERVTVRFTKQKKRFAEAEVADVLEPSPDRVEPACPHAIGFPRCGGCDWQHISIQAQRRLRVAMVEDVLRRIGKVDTSSFPLRSAEPLPPDAYRTGVRMIVTPDGSLAFRQPSSHQPFRPERCLVAHPLVDQLIATARCPGASEVSVRVGARTGDRMVVGDFELDRVSVPDGVIVAVHDQAGDAHVHEVVAGRRLRISGGAFFQSSPEGAERLVEEVQRALGDIDRSGTLIDAYSGGGLFSAIVGQNWIDAGGRVIAVESNPTAITDAVVNAPHAELHSTRFEKWDPVPASAVIADPARSGLQASGVETVVATGANRVVLVSCDAGALGRDAGLLSAAGYRITDVAVVDMFNQTSHVEVVTSFERCG